MKFVIANIQNCPSIAVADSYNLTFDGVGSASLSNEPEQLKQSPRHPQGFVDILLINCPVGSLQREEIQQRRGLQLGCFDYNEIPRSRCHSFCWKVRH